MNNIQIIDFKKPEGSFYFYLNVSKTGLDSFEFVNKLMADTGVVLTPGIDFDKKFGEKTVRLSFSSKQDIVLEATEKISCWFKKNY